MRYFLLFETAALLASLDVSHASPCRPASSATISVDVENTSTFSSFSETLFTETSTVSLNTETDTIKATTDALPTHELSTATTEFMTTETTSEAPSATIELATDVSTTDALPTIITVSTETVSSIESTDMASTTTTSPVEAPTFTNLVKNGDFGLAAQQNSFIHSFESNTGRLKPFGYTGSGSDEGNAALLMTDSNSVAVKGFLKQKINIPKGGRVAARLMYYLFSEGKSQVEYNMVMNIRETPVAFAPTDVLDTWMTLEGEVDMDAGEGDLTVTFQCATRGSFNMIVDQIVVNDEASLENLDRVKCVY
ncbi:unnamed protein product [Fusarium equiseti]|uniref:CBM-cenC domain-containing protein n=1 Tax=Fusarium equiseti TaxID=61235 RepID=A0A8J2ILI9_FUSEQ|nr:unnamed protein product [Fusarium equiseti]